MNKKTSNVNKPSNSDMLELLNNNNETKKHKSVRREENKKSKDK